MKLRETRTGPVTCLSIQLSKAGTLARRSIGWFPHAVGRFVRLRSIPWRLLMLLAGLVVQVVLTVLMWQLVDLTISLMEVWAELARKHLEVTLS